MAQFKIDENNVLRGIALEEGETVVTIPDGVVELAEWLFNKDAKFVTQVNMPNTLEVIGRECFFQCRELSEVIWGNNIKTIGSSAFWGTEKLKKVVLPDTVLTLEDSAFCWSGITEIILNEGLVEIKEKSISYCKNLTHITIPKSVKKVGKQAFSNCEKLETVTWLGKPQVVPSAFKYSGLKMNYGPDDQTVPCTDTEKF